MPLIRRKIVHEQSESTQGKIEHPDHLMYVTRRQLERGDKVVDVNEKNQNDEFVIDDVMLADLAASYPAEYEEAAKARGIAVVDLDAVVEAAAEEILKLSQKKAIAAIGEIEDPKVLGVILEHDQRAAVQKAAEVRLEALADDDPEDDEKKDA